MNENDEKDMKILYITDGNAPFVSVQLLQRSIHNALAKSGDLTEKVAGKTTSDDYYQLLLSNDLVFGFDKELLQVRKNKKLAVPVVLPSYGLGTRGMLPIWEQREYLQKGDSFICPSKPDLLAASSHLRDDQLGLYFVPYPLSDYYLEQQNCEERKKSLSKIGITDNLEWKWLLYAGRLNQQKNIHLLFNIVHNLLELGDNVHLLVAGSEDRSAFPELNWDNHNYSDLLQLEAGQLNIQDRIHFIGDIEPEAMRKVYSAMDVNVTCSTYRTEDFGFVPIEAMAEGLPTIGTAWGGFWDTIEDDITGYRMPVYQTDNGLRVDWKSGVIKIHQILNDETLKNRLSKNCRKVAFAKYNPDLFSMRMKAVLQDVVLNKSQTFKHLQLDKLLDNDTLDFFRELELAIGKNNSVVKAREGLFKKDHFSRLKKFWLAYSGDIKHDWSNQDIPYLPLKIKITNDYAYLEDKNWPGKQGITEDERNVLEVIDGKMAIFEIGNICGLNKDGIIGILRSLQAKGLVLPTTLK